MRRAGSSLVLDIDDVKMGLVDFLSKTYVESLQIPELREIVMLVFDKMKVSSSQRSRTGSLNILHSTLYYSGYDIRWTLLSAF
jgi:hypothetical protein